MHISIIAALARRGVIGRGNTMPWRVPEDLRHFKRLTLGKPVIMGRRTHESIGRVLPQRQNIIISRRAVGVVTADCVWVRSLDEAFSVARGPEVMVIGGAEIYALALPRCDRIYLTRLDLDVAGDTCFPDFNCSDWIVRDRRHHPAGELAPYQVVFKVLDRDRSA